jgi:hypothetical protein
MAKAFLVASIDNKSCGYRCFLIIARFNNDLPVIVGVFTRCCFACNQLRTALDGY